MREIAVARRAALRVLALCLAAGGSMAWARAKPGAARRGTRPPRRRPVIVIDPGHGGIDPGAIGPGGIYEKTITLATAWRLAWLLAASGRFRVVLTRSGDTFVPLPRRVAIARAAHADLFLSLHADALPDTAMRGLSVFTLSNTASDREAAELAASENRDVVAGVGPGRQSRGVRASHRAARSPRAFGGFCRADGSRHPLGAGRTGLPFQPAGGASVAAAGLPGKARPRPCPRDRGIFRGALRAPARPAGARAERAGAAASANARSPPAPDCWCAGRARRPRR